MRRRSGLGCGRRSGSAWSMRASTHEPSSISAANCCNCMTVRARSPSTRASGSAVSRCTRCTSSSPSRGKAVADRAQQRGSPLRLDSGERRRCRRCGGASAFDLTRPPLRSTPAQGLRRRSDRSRENGSPESRFRHLPATKCSGPTAPPSADLRTVGQRHTHDLHRALAHARRQPANAVRARAHCPCRPGSARA